MSKELTSSEILKIATEILQWKMPMLMTAGRLKKVKLIAGSAITQTHDHLDQNDLFNIKNRKLGKAKATISEIAEYNIAKRLILKKM